MRLSRALISALLGAAAIAVAGAGQASAASCAQAVINDWYKHGSVTGHYPAHCYTEAIAALPEDSKQYSSAPEDIRRDMLLALRGDSPSGPSGPGGGGIEPTGFGSAPIDVQAAGPTATKKKDKGFVGSFFDTFGPKNASSIPLPLIILAAIALLLLAAGAASFVARRLQQRKIDPPRP
jgi:hypothetical protein